MTFSSGGKAITAVISGLLEGLYLVFFWMLYINGRVVCWKVIVLFFWDVNG